MNGNVQVTVDADFARFGNKSYAINKINSVEVRESHPYGSGPMFGWGILAVLFALSLMGQVVSPNPTGIVVTVLLIALFAFLAYRAWHRSNIVEYRLFLMTSSSEAQALVSRDGSEIRGLRDRIEAAMTGKLAG